MNRSSWRYFTRFLGYVRPYTGLLILAVIGGIIKFTVPLLVPQVTRYLLDEVFLNRDLTASQQLRQVLLCTGGLALLFVVVYGPAVYIRHLCADKASHKAVFALRCDLYERLLQMSSEFFAKNSSGQLVSRLISDVQLAQNLVGSALTNTWMDMVAVGVILWFLIRLDIPTAAVALASFPFYVWFFRYCSSRIRTVTAQIQEELAQMAGLLNERIAANQIVQAFVREDTEARRFRRRSQRHFQTNMTRIMLQGLNQALTGVLTNIAPLVVIAFGGWRVIQARMTLGELVAITMYLGPLYQPLQRLSELNLVLANGVAALKRIFDLMDRPPQVVDRPGALELREVRGMVEFRHVWFEYEPGKPVLMDINITARPGQTIALVGQSGSGKSTIARLLLRFYDVTDGCIALDGIDIRQISVRSLRRHVGIVMQEPILLSGTVRENILYGNPLASEADLLEAARMANCLDFISALPKGFDTEVGERGGYLSAGQRQRITIARAFLKDPAVLILDEATSSLDPESEYLVQQALSRLTSGRTTFVIAHRLATVMDADWVVVLQEGRVAEQGTHEQLLTRGGIYCSLIQRQLEGAANVACRESRPWLRRYRAVGS